ncbi:hypothetical protein G6F32_016473 [Rhizopus arrhizus]|nr:hypothetical protein G6F32_016473 [Rhizopus arrhizus]
MPLVGADLGPHALGPMCGPWSAPTVYSACPCTDCSAGPCAACTSGSALGADNPTCGPAPASAAAAAAWVITTMLMRRLIGFCGSALSNSTDEDRPTPRVILLSSRPPSISARRAALARSALSSQLP